MHCTPLPSVDSVVSRLVVEEIRLKSLVGEVSLPPSSTSVLVVPSQLSTQYQNKGYVRIVVMCVTFVNKKDIRSLNVLT